MTTHPDGGHGKTLRRHSTILIPVTIAMAVVMAMLTATACQSPDESQPAQKPDTPQAVKTPDEPQPAAKPDSPQPVEKPDNSPPARELGKRQPIEEPEPESIPEPEQAPVVERDPDEVLEKLKEHDALYEAGFTVTGTTHADDWLALGLLKIATTKTWRFVYDADRCGYVMELTDHEKPVYMERIANAKWGPSYDKDGSMLVSLRAKQWGYWGDDASGNQYEDTLVKVTPANEVTEYGKGYNTMLYGPGDVGPNLPKYTILWSLGRGYSKLVNQIISAQERADGLIMVTGVGNKGEDWPGRWELEVDPSADWMVRHARFYSNRAPEKIDGEMKNDGTTRSAEYCIPETATFNFSGPIEENNDKSDPFKPVRLTFDPRVKLFDETLYADAQQTVMRSRPPNLTIFDYRTTPTRIYQPDDVAK